MTKGTSVSFAMLDVGCGTKPKGDVNIDFFRSGFNPQTGNQVQGLFMSQQKIKNFIIADASHLPFKDESFNVAFSSHTIEHVPNPFLMLREMCRVAKRKVIVRCPHRKGTGAVMPYHINYLDEDWFKKAADILGLKSNQFIIAYEYLISSRLKKICPDRLQTTLPWRALRHLERSKLMKRTKMPFEMEVGLRKNRSFIDPEVKLRFVVVYNKPEVFKKCFASSPHVSAEDVTSYNNINNESLPRFFNKIIGEHAKENVWFVFCHQDFILKEDLRPRLKGKEVEAIYGPIGIHLNGNLSGRIIQTDGTKAGSQLEEDTPVQTLDEMCLIAHSEVFRQGLSFDEKFGFHFYGADLCMRAYTLGFGVLAMQLSCQHKSRNLHGDITSADYLSALKMFSEKWRQFMPVRTTTKLIT